MHLCQMNCHVFVCFIVFFVTRTTIEIRHFHLWWCNYITVCPESAIVLSANQSSKLGLYKSKWLQKANDCPFKYCCFKGNLCFNIFNLNIHMSTILISRAALSTFGITTVLRPIDARLSQQAFYENDVVHRHFNEEKW